MTSVRGAVRHDANHRRTAVSIRWKRRSDGSNKTTPITVATKYATMNSQNFPLRPSSWGSGGASPEGRRGRRGRAGGAGARAWSRSSARRCPSRRSLPRSPDSTRRRSRGGDRPAISAAATAAATPELTTALSARSSVVVSSADTASIASSARDRTARGRRARTTGVTFSAGCRSPIVPQEHEPMLREAAVAREQHADVDRSLLERRGRERSTRVERHERRELQPVGRARGPGGRGRAPGIRAGHRTSSPDATRRRSLTLRSADAPSRSGS